MNLFQIDREHFLLLEDLRLKMNMSIREFELSQERYSFKGKPLNIRRIEDSVYISCKSVHQYLTWYLDETYFRDTSLSRLRLSLAKYVKKIPKRAVSRTLRTEIAYRQKYACANCGLFPIPPDYQIDHIVELQDGGQDIASNLAALCVPCHSAKTHKMRLLRMKQFQKKDIQNKCNPDETVAKNIQASDGSVFSSYFCGSKE